MQAGAAQAGVVIDGRFELQLLAGKGGMGRVYRAIDYTTGEPVALKMLVEDLAASPARFLREAEILAGLRHPRIVRYVKHGFTPSGEPYLAMEWLEGESLAARMARQGLSVDESVGVCRAVAEALAEAHAGGVVHRDIKPSNLFLVEGSIEQLKVLDFGIARPMNALASLTQTAAVVGTPGYMAPEQARGEDVIDPRADVFSLGAVFFECLTGRPAFEAMHVMALLAKLLMEEVPRVRELRAGVPEHIDALVHRMLTKNPGGRPRDGAAILLEIDALGTIEGPLSSPARAPREAITGSERRLLSIVAGLPEPEAPASPADTTRAAPPHDLLQRLRHFMAPLGVRVESLANGCAVAMVSGVGSPTDQAALAARCALQLRAALPRARVTLLTCWGEDTGRLPVGNLLEQAAAELAEASASSPDEARSWQDIRIDDVTRALLDARFEVVEVEGRSVLRAQREEDAEGRTLLGKPSPYVGRERELRSVIELIEETFEERRATAMLITAAPGMGKSRLRLEITKRVRQMRPAPAIVIGRGESISAGSAFAMLASAIRNALQLPAGEALEAQREKLCHAVEGFISPGERQRVAEFLGELVSVPFPDEGSPRLRAARQNAAIMEDQIQAAYLDFSRATVAPQPVLLVLEDLHWGDLPSVKLLDASLRELRDSPFMILALARPEVHQVFPRLWAERDLHEIRLSALPRRAAESLARSALGEATAPATLALIVDRADGNAFYLEELIRAVAEGRSEGLPETVLGMVEARLRALPTGLRRCLRAASVFGQTFWKGGTLALLGEDATGAALDDWIHELIERELVRTGADRRFAGEEDLVFRHALIREASYAMLTERDRALGHKLAADWLLAAGEQDPMVIAAHFEKGGEPARAAEFYLRAAEQALRGGDGDAVMTLSERGIALGAERDVAAAFRALQAESSFWRQQYQRTSDAAEDALRHATPGGKSDCRAVSAAVCSALMLQRPEALLGPMQRMLVIEPDPEGAPSLAWGFNGCILALLTMGQRDLGERYLLRMEQVTSTPAGPDPYVRGWVLHTRGYWERWVEGDYWRALTLADEAATLFEQAGDRRYLVGARIHTGWDLMHLGAFERAEEALLDGLRQAAPDSIEAWSGAFFLSDLYLARGSFEKALELAESLRQQVTARGGAATYERVTIAEATLRLGRAAEVEAEVRSLHEEMAKMPYVNLRFLCLLGEIELALGRPEEALRLVGEWFATSRALRMVQATLPQVLLLRAEALLALGQSDAAREALAEARGRALARATKVGDPELRRCFLERVRAHARTFALCKELGVPDAPEPPAPSPAPGSTPSSAR